MKFTAEQWAAVCATDRHVLVSAGAGTGKTRTVIGRVLYLLGVPVNGERLLHPTTLDRIAAITFTNAAAADLKQQLRDALRSAGRDRDVYRVDTARIGTIHAFGNEILGEFALQGAAHPNLEVLDAPAANALRTAAVRDTLLQCIDEDRVVGLAALLSEWPLRRVERMVTSLAEDPDRLRIWSGRRDALGETERTLLDLAVAATRALDRTLDDRSALDFDRVILRTRDLLRDDERVLRTLRHRISALIVDEFQDVDPVQKEIAYLLGDPAGGRPETTRLMLVGDPKQSIYRFRRADVTVWRSVERDFRERGLGLVVSTAESFRCTASVLGFVDATVGKILEQPVDASGRQDYEVAFEPLRAADAEQRRAPPVELLVVPPDEEGKERRAGDVRRIEAATLARRARELYDRGEAGWGDMAVLLPTWGMARPFQQALEGVGGRAYSLRAAGFYNQREIVDLVLALETIRDPRDDRALVGFLRSPFVGLRDDTLLAIAQQIRPPYWTGLSEVAVAEQESLDWAATLLRRFVAMRDRVPTDELLDGLLHETGYVAHLRLMGPAQAQAIANVEKFLRQARSASRLSVGELLALVAEARVREGDEGEVPVVPRADAVTITTVHSAKGLQWPVVFWADLVRQPGPVDGGDVLVGRDAFVVRDPRVERSTDQPQRWQEMRQQIQQEETAERKRVWYVAATRASERLILSGLPAGTSGRRSRGSVADSIWEALGHISLIDGAPFEYGAHDGTTYRGIIRLADPHAAAVGVAEGTEPGVQPAETLPDVFSPLDAPPGSSQHSATELLTYARCPRRHWFKYLMGIREPDVDRGTAGFIDAVTRGLIVHDVLQHLAEQDELDALLEDAIGRWDEHAPPPDAPEGGRYRDHLRVEITNVAGHPDYRALADLPAARRELGFLYLAEQDASYRGHIDLAACRGEGLALLDVKTSRVDRTSARERAAHYSPQRDVYVTAAEEIAGLPVNEFDFQFSQAAVHVREEITDDVRGEARVFLERVVARLGRERPGLTDHPGECRFCGYRAVGWCSGVAEPSSDGAAGGLQLGLDL